MGCGCLKVRTDTDENKKKTLALARKLAEAENQTYIIYEKDNEEFTEPAKGWDGNGKVSAIVEP